MSNIVKAKAVEFEVRVERTGSEDGDWDRAEKLLDEQLAQWGPPADVTEDVDGPERVFTVRFTS